MCSAPRRSQARAASCFLACCVCILLQQSVYATVVLQTNNFTTGFADLPADFGPEVPPEGIQGLLLVADPEHACTELKPPPTSITSPWVALVVRSQAIDGCTFDMKVVHAEQAGAIAAIVYDDVFEPLVLMAKDPRHPDPFIPAVFVSHRSGLMMKRLTEEGKTVVTLTPMSERVWLSMLMSACAGFLAVNVVLGALWVMRRQRIVAGMAGGPGLSSLPRQGMTAEEIRQLPIIVYEEPATTAGTASSAAAAATAVATTSSGVQGGDGSPEPGGSDSGSDSGRKGGGTRHTCAICLEGYCHGEKLRVLPCQHRYHSECVDTWLANRHPNCPVCKADAHAPSPDSDVEAGSGAAGAGLPGWQRRGAAFLASLGTWRGLSPWRHADGGGRAGQAGGAAAAAAGGTSLDTAPEQQQLLGGSRSSSPVIVPGGQAAQGNPSPALASASRLAAAAAEAEITPEGVEAPGVATAAAQALLPAPVSASWHASSTQVCAGSSRRSSLPGNDGGEAGSSGSSLPAHVSVGRGGGSSSFPLRISGGLGSGRRSGATSLSSSASHSPAHQLRPDSTEGSEVESEAE